MRIAIDGGGLCTLPGKRFGNFVFSLNLIQSILDNDRNNYYSVYSLCHRPAELNLTSLSDYRILLPHRLWMKVRVSLEEFLQKSHVFLALNQAIPLYTRAKIIAFSHGLSYYHFPHLYRDNFFRLSIHLGDMIKRSGDIIVSSERVKEEMNDMFPQYKNITVIPYGVPLDMLDYQKTNKEKYFLFAGMNHPIKNIRFLQKVMKSFPGYKLVIASDIDRKELKKLYGKATAYITASYYESFNLPVLEALAQGTPVVGLPSAIIPELAPYVNVAADKEEFIEKLRLVAAGKVRMPDRDEITRKFSWKQYVHQLVKLYNE